jgi:hypothetical protein
MAQRATHIPAPEANWLIKLLSDHDEPRPVPSNPTEVEDRLKGLEATVRMLVSIMDPQEIAAAMRLQKSSIDNQQLLEWAARCEAPADLVTVQEERPW